MATTKIKTETEETKFVYKYQCPACTNTAIETTNKMLGVNVVCKSCDKVIVLTEPDRYQLL